MWEHRACPNCQEYVTPEGHAVDQTNPDGTVSTSLMWICPACDSLLGYS